MLGLPWISLFIRTIPEGIILTWLSYLQAAKPINRKSIFVSGLLIGCITYIIRLFPINFGVHILLILISYIFVLYKLNKIELYQAVRAGLTTYILLSVSELVTMLIYVFLFKMDMEAIPQRSLQGILLGMPSLLLVFITGLLIRYFKKIKPTGADGNV